MYKMTYSFPYLEPVCCSVFSSNCCFLTCIQVSQEAGQVVWYSHLFQNFPQFAVIHTVKGFGIVNKAEIDVFLELSCFFDDPVDVGNLISFSLWELECKSMKSRDTWSNRYIWPFCTPSTEWSRAKANRVLPRECTGHSKHPLPTNTGKTLHMDITRWSTPKSDWLYSLQPNIEKIYTVSKNKTGSWLWLRSWTPYCQIQT